MFKVGTRTSVQLSSASSSSKLGSTMVPLLSIVNTLLLQKLVAYNDAESPEIMSTFEENTSLFTGLVPAGSFVGTWLSAVPAVSCDVLLASGHFGPALNFATLA